MYDEGMRMASFLAVSCDPIGYKAMEIREWSSRGYSHTDPYRPMHRAWPPMSHPSCACSYGGYPGNTLRVVPQCGARRYSGPLRHLGVDQSGGAGGLQSH